MRRPIAALALDFTRTTILSLFLAPLAVATTFAQQLPASDSLAKVLTAIATEAVTAQSSVRATGDIDGSLRNTKHGGAFRPALESRLAEIALRRTSLVAKGLVYKNPRTTLTASDAKIQADRATLRGVETTSLDQVEGGTELPPFKYVSQHAFEFRNASGSWQLTADSVVNAEGSGLRGQGGPIKWPRASTQRSLTPTRPVRTHPPTAIRYDEDTGPFHFASVGVAPKRRFATLDPNAIVIYANNYWYPYNSSYRDFETSGIRGGDCTNFVSQALKAGGWTEVDGYYTDDRFWWYGIATQTYTWVNAHKWNIFTANRPRGSGAPSVWDLEPGDILQLDFEGDGEIDHSMIVVSKPNGVPHLNYHTQPTWGRSLEDILASWPDAWYYAVWLDYTFQ